MFGLVTANWKELDRDQRSRYSGVYCGICLRIREQSGQVARVSLSYDMAFLAMLLMSRHDAAILKAHHNYIHQLHVSGDQSYVAEEKMRRAQFLTPLENIVF